jgi:hypothetical protein
MSRNYSERTSNNRSKQSSEKARQAEAPAGRGMTGSSPVPAPSAKPGLSSKPSAAPAASPPQAAPAPKTSTAVATRPCASPTQEQIAERAKSIWMKSGRLPGRDKENWLEAERQLRAEMNRP